MTDNQRHMKEVYFEAISIQSIAKRWLDAFSPESEGDDLRSIEKHINNAVSRMLDALEKSGIRK